LIPFLVAHFAFFLPSYEQGTFELPQVDKPQNSADITLQKLILILEEISLKSRKPAYVFHFKTRCPRDEILIYCAI
jgi:hypothetical protein